MGKLEFKKDKKGQFYYHVLSDNGNVLVHSESYTRLTNAKKSAVSLMRVMTSRFTVVPYVKANPSKLKSGTTKTGKLKTSKSKIY